MRLICITTAFVCAVQLQASQRDSNNLSSKLENSTQSSPFSLQISTQPHPNTCKNSFGANNYDFSRDSQKDLSLSNLSDDELIGQAFKIQEELTVGYAKLGSKVTQSDEYQAYLKLIVELLTRSGIEFKLERKIKSRPSVAEEVFTILPVSRNPRLVQNTDLKNRINTGRNLLNHFAFMLAKENFELLFLPELFVRAHSYGTYSKEAKFISISLLDLVTSEKAIGYTTHHELLHFAVQKHAPYWSFLKMNLDDKNESYYTSLPYDEILAVSKPEVAKLIALKPTDSSSLEIFLSEQERVLEFVDRMVRALDAISLKKLGNPTKTHSSAQSLSIDFSSKSYAMFVYETASVKFYLNSRQVIEFYLSENEKMSLKQILSDGVWGRTKTISRAERHLLDSILLRISNFLSFNSILAHELNSIVFKSSKFHNAQPKFTLQDLDSDKRIELERIVNSTLNCIHNIRQLFKLDGSQRIPFEYRDFRFTLPKN